MPNKRGGLNKWGGGGKIFPKINKRGGWGIFQKLNKRGGGGSRILIFRKSILMTKELFIFK